MAQVRRDSWDDFIEEGDVLFQYMIDNFDSMFDKDKNTINYFGIRNEGCYDICSDEIMENYGPLIEKKANIWIHEQYSKGLLFEKNNWKPFRDRDQFYDAYLGYNQTFNYEQYYFYLSINGEYMEYEPGKCKNITHFEIVLMYGLEDKRIKPDSRVIIPDNNIVPEFYWGRK